MKSMDLRTLAAAKLGRSLISKIISYKPGQEDLPKEVQGENPGQP